MLVLSPLNTNYSILLYKSFLVNIQIWSFAELSSKNDSRYETRFSIVWQAKRLKLFYWSFTLENSEHRIALRTSRIGIWNIINLHRKCFGLLDQLDNSFNLVKEIFTSSVLARSCVPWNFRSCFHIFASKKTVESRVK